uniref:Uncharacterized protein n=1 Tax=uncultured marine group II/III euryarchaeote AD1000_79_C02 TaxID=1457812 RepID=A0A075FYQ9_9EURY|nr:hypothetical protein [uncultured marine group II/III euryarchaeote AD1000_79_C02]
MKTPGTIPSEFGFLDSIQLSVNANNPMMKTIVCSQYFGFCFAETLRTPSSISILRNSLVLPNPKRYARPTVNRIVNNVENRLSTGLTSISASLNSMNPTASSTRGTESIAIR